MPKGIVTRQDGILSAEIEYLKALVEGKNLEGYSPINEMPFSEILENIIERLEDIELKEERKTEKLKISNTSLKESKEFLDKIINSIGDPIFVKDRNHNLILFNDALCKLCGRSRDELMNGNAYDFFPKEQVEVFKKNVEDVYNTGKESINEELLTDSRGITHTILTKKTLYVDKSGKKFIVGVIRDFTERKRTEELLRLQRDLATVLSSVGDQREAMRQILDAALKIEGIDGGGVYVVDESAGGLDLIIYKGVSSKFAEGCAHYGANSFRANMAKSGKAIYLNYEDIVQPQFDDIREEGLRSIAVLPVMYQGQVIALFNAASHTYDKIPQCTRTTLEALATDIGEILTRIRATIELQKAKEAAEIAVRSKSEFLATMSHEIRTPLNAIIGLTDLLMGSEMALEQQEWIETIRNSGEVLLSVINDILDFSKIESGRMELESSPFGLRQCIEESIELVAPKAMKKNLVLDYALDESVPDTIVADSTRLRQILTNLLSNAVKFTDKGWIEIFVKAERENDNALELCFDVLDTGIGINNGDMKKLFQPFSQVDMSTTRKYGGTGLGLAICKKLSEQMGGKIWAESEPGKGSTFHFTIRAQSHFGETFSARALPVCSGIDRCSGDGMMLHVLLAEDDPINQRVAMLMLRRLGHIVDAVSNGHEVLQAMENKVYDLVFMDIQMPEMDGFETARAIRQRWPAVNQPRIIALTAYALKGDRERCLSAGMDGYISKPVKIKELRAAIESCIFFAALPPI